MIMRYMVKIFATCFILMLLLMPSAAEAVKLKHAISVYFDGQKKGIKRPESVACNEDIFIVADTGNGRLLKYTLQNEDLGTGITEVKAEQLPYPIRIRMNSKNEIYALDGRSRRIVYLSPEGMFKGYIEPDLPSPVSYIPRGFDIDERDNIYILDVLSERVLVLNPEGKYQKHIKFPKDYGFFSDISVDFKGNILLIDSINAMVFSAAKDSASFSPLSKSLKEYMRFPTSLTTDRRGRIYLVDRNGSQIIILSHEGSFIGQQLGMGWKEGLLNYPSQLCINDKDEIFIADTNNSRIQIFVLLK